MTLVLDVRAADRAMQQLRRNARPIPVAAELGVDLLVTTRRQFVTAVSRPLLPFVAYWWAATSGRMLLAVALVPVLFLADVVIVHDLMHHNVGRTPRTNGLALSVLAALMLESGHALETTHAAHHRRFPSHDDPEGYLSGWPLWRVILEGPIYRYKLWCWAWRNHRSHRGAMGTEFAVHGLVVAAALVGFTVGRFTPLVVFVATAVAASWLFPIISVTAVHDAHGAGPLQQSRTLRGWLVPGAMLGMGYHLEHHLWPMIPSHHLGEAAARADRILRDNGAAITRTP